MSEKSLPFLALSLTTNLGADATRGCRELAATVRSAMAITEDYISYSEIIQDAKYTEKDKQHLPLGIERYGL